MKKFILWGLCLFPFSALASEYVPQRICGRFDILAPSGMLMIMRPVLLVSQNPPAPETTYYLSSEAPTVDQVAERQALISSLQVGQHYCLLGQLLPVYGNYQVLTPHSIEREP